MFGSGSRFGFLDRTSTKHRRKHADGANPRPAADPSRRRHRSYRPGAGGLAFEDLESRVLLSSDLTQQIDNILSSGSYSNPVTLSNVSVGNFLSIGSATLTFQNISQQGSNWSGSVSVSVDTANLALGTAFNAAIVGDATHAGLTGSYNLSNAPLGQGSFSLNVTELDVTAGNLLTGTAKGVAITYAPGSSAVQQLAHVSSLTASLTPLHNAAVNLNNLDIYNNGFALENGSFTPDSVQLGGILTAANPTVTFSGIGYTAGSTPVGTVNLKVPHASLFPNQSTFTATVDNLNGSYDFGGGTFALTADDVMMGIGNILTANATGLTLGYTPSTNALSVSAATADLKSPDFAGLDASVQMFSADGTGLSIGNANLTMSSPNATVDIGHLIEASGLSVSLNGFHYQTNPTQGTNPFSGTLNVGASGAVTLFPGTNPFTATVNNFHGSFDLNRAALSLSADSANVQVGSILSVSALNTSFTLTPQAGGGESVGVIIGSATATLPKFGVAGTVNNLQITNDGFTADSTTISVPAGQTKTISFGKFSIQNPSVTLSGFGYSISHGATFNGKVTLGADEIDLNASGSIGVAATGITSSISFQPGDLGHFTFTANTVHAHFTSYLDLEADGVAFDSAPTSGNIAQFGNAVSATFKLPDGTSVTGTGRDFAINANGSFVAGPTFGVSIGFTKSDQLKWPSWLPLQLSYVGVSWNDFTNNPSSFTLDVSASVNLTVPGTSLHLSGFVKHAVIDVSMLENNQFPITSLGGFGISAGGNVYGFDISGSMFIAILNVDSSFQPIADGDTTHAIAHSYLYGGIDAAFNLEGISGFEIRIGISPFGPLDVFFQAAKAQLIDPDTGLAITNFRGGIDVGTTLPSITNAKDLSTNPKFKPPAQQSLQDWSDQLAGQVATVAQEYYLAPNLATTFSEMAQNITINGGATLFDEYAGTGTFTLDGDILLSFDGKIEVAGNLTFGSGFKVAGAAYMDLSQVAAGKAQLLMYIKAPADAPIVTAYGGVGLQFSGAALPPALGTGLTLNAPAAGSTTPGSTDYASAPGINLNGSSYTVEFWAQRADTGRAEEVIGQDDAQTGSDLQIGFDASNNFFVTSGGQTLSVAGTDGNWHHWAVTFDKYTGTRTIYEDGAWMASDTAAPLANTSITLLIGKSGTTYFDGSVDEVRVWAVPRAVADIRKNYLTTTLTSTTGLLADWTFSEGRGISAADSSGNGKIASLNGTPTWELTSVNPPPAGSLGTFTMTVNGEVDLTLPSLPGALAITATAVFTVNPAQSTLDMSVVGTVNLDPLGNLLNLNGKVHIDTPTFDAKGNVTFDGDAYAAFAISNGQLSELQQLGINVAGTTILRFNTSMQPVSVSLPTIVPDGSPAPGSGPNAPPATTIYYLPAQSFSMTINGSADFQKGGQDWFSINGQFDAFFNFASGQSPILQIDTDGMLNVGPATAPVASFHVDGYLQVSKAGIAADFGVGIQSSQALQNAGITLQYVQNGVTKDDTFTFLLNTTGQEVDYTIPALDAPGIPVVGAGSQQIKIPAGPSGSNAPSTYLEIDGVGGLMLTDQISGSAQVNMTGSFQLLVVPGTLTFNLNTDFTFTVLGAPIESFHAQGGLILQQGQGLSAALQLQQKTNLPSSLGIGLNASYMMEVNTTGLGQSPGGIAIPAGRYIRIHAHGDMTVQTFDVIGDFDLSADSGGLTIAAAGSTALGLLGSTSVDGVLTVQTGSNPGVYGFLESTGGVSAPSQAGFSLNSGASFELEVNTLSTAQTVSTIINGSPRGFTVDPATMNVTPASTITIPRNTVSLVAGGHVLIAGLFDLSGEFDFSLSGSDLQAHARAQLQNFLGANLALNAMIDFFGNDALGQGGLVINAAMSLSSGSLGVANFSLSASPSLIVNTSNVGRGGITPNTFETALNNASINVLGFQASGSLMVGVNNGQFEIVVPQSNPLNISLFGLGGVSAYGYIESNGQFSLSGSVGFDLGSGGNDLYGSVNVTLANSGFYSSFSGGASVFGINLASVSGSLYITSGHVHLGATVYVLLSSFTFDFDLGQLTTPPVNSSIYWYSVPSNANEGDTVTLDAAATTSSIPNPSDGSYVWTIYSRGQVYSQSSGAKDVVRLNEPGTYTVALNVAGLSRVSTIQVANISPTITSLGNNLAYPFGTSLTIKPSVIDPGTADTNGGLSYAWTLSQGTTTVLTSQSPTFSFTPPNPGTTSQSASQPAVYQVTLTVTDSSGAVTTASSSFVVFDPSNIVVNTLADYSGPVTSGNTTYTSLRFAMYEAQTVAGVNYVKFDPSLAGKTITLLAYGDTADHGNSFLAVKNGYVFLDGSTAPGLTISGQGAASPARLFYVAKGTSLDIYDVNLANGYATGVTGVASGGGVYTDGSLNLFNSAMINNEAVGLQVPNSTSLQPSGLGGAVFIGPTGNLTAFNDTFVSNVALGANGTTAYPYGGGGYGGAIYNQNTMQLQSNTIANNFAIAGSLPGLASFGQGGGVYDAALSSSGYINRTVYSNIVARNTGGPDYYIANPTLVSGAANLIGSIVNTPSTVVYPFIASSADPMFASLTSLDHGNGVLSLSLLPGSPAIGKGVTDSSPLDGRGYPRIANGHLDIGAFETQPYLVTNTNDSGPGSLRAAIAQDDNQSTISFAPNLAGQKITLTSGPIVINNNVSINGPYGGPMTISGNGASRIFTIGSNATVSLFGLTLANGLAQQGGAIYNSGNLTIQNLDFTGNVARSAVINATPVNAQGGAIYNAAGAVLSVVGSTFDNDTSVGLAGGSGPNAQGGAVYNAPGGSFSASNDTFANDTATGANVYGTDGYELATIKPLYPTYATVGYSGSNSFTWASTTNDPRALQKPVSSANDRLASTFYSVSQSFTIDVNLTDGQLHNVTLYALDWDGNNGRSERIDVLSAQGAVIDSRTISSFGNGVYLTWAVQGHVKFKVTTLTASNAVIAGIFFDKATSGAAGPLTFIGTDAVSQGNWKASTAGAGFGGAIDNAGTAALENVTISGSSVNNGFGLAPAIPSNGAGVENEAGATLTLYNTLIAGNTGGNDLANLGAAYGGSNLVTTSTGVASSVLLGPAALANPAIRQLAYNGGTTPTFGIQTGSGAVDSGDNGAANSPIATIAGLLDWWRGDGNSYDSTRNFKSSLFNGATFATGVDGQAFSFNGQGAYVGLGSSPDVIGTGAFSVSAWIKTNSNGVILQQRDPNNYNGEYMLAVVGGKVSWMTYGDFNYGFNFTSNRSVNDNGWHLVTAVRLANGTGQIYIDGALDNSQAGAPRTLSSGFNVYIGGDLRDNTAFFNGLIDDVAIFGRGLTAPEVKTLLIGSPTDQRWLPRVANGTVDVGAVELQPFVVINTNDSGYGSLRQAVADDAAGDQPVIFSPLLNGKTITLTTGPITIGHNLTINGPGASMLTISGGNAVEDFAISGGNVAISGLTIANGLATQGGGISNAGSLTVTNSVFSGDVAQGNSTTPSLGGAIYNAPGSALNVTGSTFNNDTASSLSTISSPLASGGAIYNAPGAILNASDNTFNADQAVTRRVYGAEGYYIPNSKANLPSYAAFVTSGINTFTWAASTTDPRALQKPDASDRIASTFYNVNLTFAIDLSLNDGQVHNITLYALDWDGNNTRSERIDVLNAQGTVIDSRTISSFSSGVYLTWAVQGHVQFKVTSLTVANAVIAGIFFDKASAGASGPATFLGMDTLSQGTWKGTALAIATGGAVDNAGSASLINDTIAGNSVTSGPLVSSDGSGIYNEPGAKLTLINTIVANGTGGRDLVNLGVVNGDGNLVTTSAGLPSGVVATSAAPMLGTLKNNGGPTPTMALAAGSPAIDAGDAGAAGLPANDQRGLPRIAGASADIGAYEYATPILVTNANASGPGSLLAALTTAASFPGSPIGFVSSLAGQTITLASELILSGNITIDGSAAPGLTIRGNGFQATDGSSRVVYVASGTTVTLRNLTITGGYADLGGGIYNAGKLIVQDCAIVSNVAFNSGGGIDNESTLSVIDSTVANNKLVAVISGSAYQGGGIRNYGYLNLEGDTISKNLAILGSSSGIGGGLADTAGTIQIHNTIIWGNSAPSGSGQDVASIQGPILSLGHNFVGDSAGVIAYGATDKLGVNPQLGPLQNNGGPTFTMAPAAGSPVIDAGDPAGAPSTDQRGYARSSGQTVDVGAYERQPYVVTSTADSGPGTLRQAIALDNDGSPIVFAPSLAGSTITAVGELLISRNITIDGSAAPGLIISGNGLNRVFEIASGSTVTLTNLSVENGQATTGGGILNGGTLTLNGVTVAKNAASGNGGGIENAGVLSLVNSTVAFNTATVNGGGIDTTGTLNLLDVTVADNTAAAGGGVDVESGSTTARNSIVAVNTATTSPDLAGALASFGHNLIGNAAGVTGLTATDLSGVNPLLGVLLNNGGPTPTLALSAGSPAIDAGDPTGASSLDQRGLPRVVNGAIDIGAYEAQIVAPQSDPGDPYLIHEGDSLTFNATDSTDPQGLPLTYSWDVNGDGTFGDASGVSPTLTWSQLQALGIKGQSTPYQIRVQESDGYHAVISNPVTLTVLPALHVTSLTIPQASNSATPVDSVTVTFSGPVFASGLASALSLTLGGTPVAIPSTIQIQPVAGAVGAYQISGLSKVTQTNGQYMLTINATKVSDALGAGFGVATIAWLMDTSAPDSNAVSPAATTSVTIPVTAVGDDVTIKPGVPNSALVACDLYVSVDGAPFTYWTTVHPWAPTAQYQGKAGHSYAFFSQGHDATGNFEIKTAAETRTRVVSADPPATRVTSVDATTSNFRVAYSGHPSAGNSLVGIDLFVQIDGGAPQRFDSSTATAGVVNYSARLDGQTHAYRFYSVGTDQNGRVEAVPTIGSDDVVVKAAFSPTPVTPAITTVHPTGLVVQGGAAERSYIRFVDLAFAENTDLGTLVSNGSVHLVDYNLATGTPKEVPLAGVLHAVDHAIEFDFGANGLGGNPNSREGDGNYVVSVDGSPQTFAFDRLLGDLNGDGRVNAVDLRTAAWAIRHPQAGVNGDANGDGVANRADLIDIRRSLGDRLTPATSSTPFSRHAPRIHRPRINAMSIPTSTTPAGIQRASFNSIAPAEGTTWEPLSVNPSSRTTSTRRRGI